MKVKMIVKIVVVLILLLAVIVAVAYFIRHKKPEPEEELTGIKGTDAVGIKLAGTEKVEKLRYHYSGTAIGDIYTYEIYKEDGEVKLKAEYMNINEDDPDVVTIESDTLDKITELVKKHGVNEWDGYRKSDTWVLDGDGFSMTISLDDGRKISFSGSNCAPEGYYSFEKELLELIESYVSEIRSKLDFSID